MDMYSGGNTAITTISMCVENMYGLEEGQRTAVFQDCILWLSNVVISYKLEFTF